MFNKSVVLMSLFVALMALPGCYSTKMYLADKPRVDQELPGMAPADDSREKTRKVVVLEVIEKGQAAVPQPQSDLVVKASVNNVVGQSEVVAEEKGTAVVHSSNFTFPTMNSPYPEGIPSKTSSVYKVEKDDTLQKIAKKFYGSYSKWTKIYDANKDVIKDPNFVKPGTILKVPALEVAPEVPVETQQ